MAEKLTKSKMFLQIGFYFAICKKMGQTPLFDLESIYTIDDKTQAITKLSLSDPPEYIPPANVYYHLNNVVTDKDKHLISFFDWLLCLDNGDLYFNDYFYGPIALFNYKVWSKYVFGSNINLAELIKVYIDSLLKQDPNILLDISSRNTPTGSTLYDSLVSFVFSDTNISIDKFVSTRDDAVIKVKYPQDVPKGKTTPLRNLSYIYGVITSYGENNSLNNTQFYQIRNADRANSSDVRDYLSAAMGMKKTFDKPTEYKAYIIEEIMEATGNLQYEPTKESLAKIGLDKYCTNRELSSFAKNHQTLYMDKESNVSPNRSKYFRIWCKLVDMTYDLVK